MWKLGVIISFALFAIVHVSAGSIGANLIDNAHIDSEVNQTWDIQKKIALSKFVHKLQGHEGIVELAFDKIPNAASAMHLQSMITGVHFVDMPGRGSRMDEALTITKVNRKWVLPFLKRYVLGEHFGMIENITGASHYGCLQIWHSMSPTFIFTNKALRRVRSKHWSYVHTNEDVYNIIMGSMKRQWDNAVQTLKVKNKKNLANFFFGRTLHTVADSYAGGHTYRGNYEQSPSSTNNADGYPTCGPIQVFQEYGAQAGNKAHGDADHADKTNTTPAYLCAVGSTVQLMRKWVECTLGAGTSACAFPTAEYAAVFRVDHAHLNNLSGGAVERYKGNAATISIKYAGGLEVFFPPMKNINIRRGKHTENACDESYVKADLSFARAIIPDQVDITGANSDNLIKFPPGDLTFNGGKSEDSFPDVEENPEDIQIDKTNEDANDQKMDALQEISPAAQATDYQSPIEADLNALDDEPAAATPSSPVSAPVAAPSNVLQPAAARF